MDHLSHPSDGCVHEQMIMVATSIMARILQMTIYIYNKLMHVCRLLLSLVKLVVVKPHNFLNTY